MSKETASEDRRGHLNRWVMPFVLAAIAAVVGRQIAVSSADREFEARLAQLDANRDNA